MTVSRWSVSLAALLSLAVLCACVPGGPAYEHPAAVALDKLLEVRSKAPTDPAAYSPYVKGEDFAVVLAEDAADREGDTPPVPGWRRPYVSAVGTDGAVEVVVSWRSSADHPGFPRAHRFTLVEESGAWLVTDAFPVEGEEPPRPLVELAP